MQQISSSKLVLFDYCSNWLSYIKDIHSCVQKRPALVPSLNEWTLPTSPILPFILPFLHRSKLFLNKIAINKNYNNLMSITNSTSKAYLLLYILKSIPLGSMLNHFYNNGIKMFYRSSVTTVTGYRLDDWSSIACRNRDISLLHHVKTASAINPLDTGGIFCFI